MGYACKLNNSNGEYAYFFYIYYEFSLTSQASVFNNVEMGSSYRKASTDSARYRIDFRYDTKSKQWCLDSTSPPDMDGEDNTYRLTATSNTFTGKSTDNRWGEGRSKLKINNISIDFYIIKGSTTFHKIYDIL